MPENPLGWRRLWPSKLWLQTVQEGITGGATGQPAKWQWRIWSLDKTRLLATGAETYSRQRDAARGGVRFGETERARLEAM